MCELVVNEDQSDRIQIVDSAAVPCQPPSAGLEISSEVVCFGSDSDLEKQPSIQSLMRNHNDRMSAFTVSCEPIPLTRRCYHF